MANYEPSHLDLHCLPFRFFSFFNLVPFILKVFRNFANVILSAFLALHRLRNRFVMTAICYLIYHCLDEVMNFYFSKRGSST